jgi:two-component system, sensor histidine kinase LadS
MKIARAAFLIIFVGMMLSSCKNEYQPDSSSYFLFQDSTLSLNARDAWQYFQKGKFLPQEGHSFNAGFTTSAYWLVVQNDTLSSQQLQLEIGTSQINEIEFYAIEGGVPVKKYITGDHHVFFSRPEPLLNFNFPLERNIRHYLIRIDKRNEALQLTFLTQSANHFRQEALQSALIIGMLTGIAILMVIFGLYLTIMTKEKVYLFYTLYVTAGWLYVLANLGYGYKYMWPDSPWFAARARPIFTLLSVGLSLNFIEHYTGKAAFVWLHKSMQFLNYFTYALVIIVLLPIVDLRMDKAGYYFQILIPVLPILYIVIVLTTLIQKISTGNRMAIFYLVSISPIAIFSALQIAYYSGGVDISGSFLQQYGQPAGFMLEALILTFGLVYRFNSYRLEKEQLLVKVNQQQIKYTKAIITTQESERRRLADQLHDVAGSLLSAAKLNLSSVREKDFITNEDTRNKLSQAENAVTDISEMLRKLSHAISPVMLDKVGFKQSVEKIAGIFNTSGKISVELEVVGFDKEQPELYEKYSVLYGILYELVNNIVKHAQASHALIQLIEHEDSVVMIVEDDGTGLDVNSMQKSATHGLAAIQSKIHYLNGKIIFDKATPHGLIVAIEIPKDEKENNPGR